MDGLFLDIVKEQDCACPRCLRGMAEEGLNASVAEDRLAFGREVTRGFRSDLTAFIRTLDQRCSLFYNGGHVGPELRPSVLTYTHFELESLPSGGWGYLHFPISMRYARTLGKDCLGMTGRFHTSWGDFHSLKNPAALQFECFQMLALGAKCSVGDQLHPSGRIDPATYDLIGEDDRINVLGLPPVPGENVHCQIVKPDGTTIDFEAVHTFSPEQVEWFKAGSALNIVRQKVAAAD